MSYSHSVAFMAKKFPWQSWIMYNQTFREEATYLPARGQCSPLCKVLQLGTKLSDAQLVLELPITGAPDRPVPPQTIRYQVSKKGWPQTRGSLLETQNNDGGCKYGAKCRFAHKCFSCGGPHPYSRCSRKGKEKARNHRSKLS